MRHFTFSLKFPGFSQTKDKIQLVGFGQHSNLHLIGSKGSKRLLATTWKGEKLGLSLRNAETHSYIARLDQDGYRIISPLHHYFHEINKEWIAMCFCLPALRRLLKEWLGGRRWFIYLSLWLIWDTSQVVGDPPGRPRSLPDVLWFSCLKAKESGQPSADLVPIWTVPILMKCPWRMCVVE